MIKKVILDKADRIYHFPFDLEDFMPKKSIKAVSKKVPPIDLAHFNWNIKNNFNADADPFALARTEDTNRLKERISDWFSTEHKVAVNPKKEIYIGQGIHRIIHNMMLAYVEYGDVVLCPEPGMPFYKRLTIATGGVPVTYPVFTRSDYKPSLTRVDSNLGKAAKLMILNNPNNPAGIMHDETELEEIIHIASRRNIFLINDAAYCSLAEEKYRPFKAIPGGGKVAVEIFSIPFTFGLGYVPLGFAIGPAEVISDIESIDKTIKSVIPKGWIDASIEAIQKYPSEELIAFGKTISQSRIAAEKLIDQMNCERIGGKSCPFIWIRIPERKHSDSFASSLLRRRQIITLPGSAFGETCDGFLRLSLTASVSDYEEATERMSKKFSLLARQDETETGD